MVLFNARSINKSFLINDLILDHTLNCLFLTETWLSTDTSSVLLKASPLSNNFSFVNSMRNKAGGVAVILKSSLRFREGLIGALTTFEHHWAVLCSPAIFRVCVITGVVSPVHLLSQIFHKSCPLSIKNIAKSSFFILTCKSIICQKHLQLILKMFLTV